MTESTEVDENNSDLEDDTSLNDPDNPDIMSDIEFFQSATTKETEIWKEKNGNKTVSYFKSSMLRLKAQ
eukprot:8190472-Ditylum_brightwellii.AAC.1